MHIVLGLLTSIITILYLLDRMGVDIGGLNPFYWYRRRAFAKNYGSDPIFSVEDPIHIAALLVIGTAKVDGDLTADQKSAAQELFISEFSISDQEASELFGSAAHLLAAPQLIDSQLTKLIDRNTERFSPDQAKSLLQMVQDVASRGGDPSHAQSGLIAHMREQLIREPKGTGTWD